MTSGRVATLQTVGSSGGLRVGADFIKRWLPASEVWISDPSWDNHRAMFEGAGLAGLYPHQLVKLAEQMAHNSSGSIPQQAVTAAAMKAAYRLFAGEDDDEALVNDLLAWMERQSADFTNTFRSLTGGDPGGGRRHPGSPLRSPGIGSHRPRGVPTKYPTGGSLWRIACNVSSVGMPRSITQIRSALP